MPETADSRESWLDEVVRQFHDPPDGRPQAIDALLEEAFERRPPRQPEVRRKVRAGWWRWLRGRRVSPLATVGWAVAAVVATLYLGSAAGEAPTRQASSVTAPRVHQFVLVAPRAQSVSVVGDFNSWQVGATPLTRNGDVWTVEVELEPGRHVYSFVVDESDWRPDQTAPRAVGEEFGRPSSVLLFAGAGA